MSEVFDIAILGGGVSGLATHSMLKDTSLSSVLLEGSDELGGLARTFEFQGHRYDSGAHRLHMKNPEIAKFYKQLLGDQIKPVHSPSKIYSHQKFINFPLKPLDLFLSLGPKNFLKASFSFLSTKKINQPKNFQEYAYSKYGEELANNFLINYSEKLWGLSADQLSLSISGERLKGLDLLTLLLEFFSSKSSTRHLDGSFFYPVKGIGELAKALEKQNPENIKKNFKIIQIERKEHYFLVSSDTESIKANKIISTIPITSLAKVIKIDVSPDLQFRHVQLITLRVNKPHVSENASIYLPDKQIPITRIYESKNRSSQMSPSKETTITIEVPTEAPIESIEPIITYLVEELKLIKASDIVAQEIKFLKNAYPILSTTSQPILDDLKAQVEKELPGVLLTGRSGNFKYLHLHDLIEESINLVRQLES